MTPPERDVRTGRRRIDRHGLPRGGDGAIMIAAGCGSGGGSTPTTPTPAATSGATIVINNQGAVS